MPQLIFFRQTDELATLSVEEQSDAWWAGAQRCFAAVPIAAAAAVALSASLAFGAQQQTDDIVPQAALDDGYCQVVAPPPAPPGFLYLPDLEEIPAGSLRATAEEDYWWSPPITSSASIPQPRAVDDDLPVAVALDDTSWSPPTPLVRLLASSPQLWAIEDDFSPTIDDPYWWMVVLSPQSPLPLLPLDDQAVPAAPVAAPPEEDLWQVTTPGPLPPRFLYLPDPEAIPGVLLGTVDDEPWAQPWIVKPSTPGQLWTLADELPITAALDSDGWSSPVVSLRATVLTPWVDEDVKLTPPPPLGVDEVYVWRAYSIPAPVVASAWLVEIDGVQPRLFIHVDVVRLVNAVGSSSELIDVGSSVSELLDSEGMA